MSVFGVETYIDTYCIQYDNTTSEYYLYVQLDNNDNPLDTTKAYSELGP